MTDKVIWPKEQPIYKLLTHYVGHHTHQELMGSEQYCAITQQLARQGVVLMTVGVKEPGFVPRIEVVDLTDLVYLRESSGYKSEGEDDGWESEADFLKRQKHKIDSVEELAAIFGRPLSDVEQEEQLARLSKCCEPHEPFVVRVKDEVDAIGAHERIDRAEKLVPPQPVQVKSPQPITGGLWAAGKYFQEAFPAAAVKAPHQCCGKGTCHPKAEVVEAIEPDWVKDFRSMEGVEIEIEE
jgi:hypothetical protein